MHKTKSEAESLELVLTEFLSKSNINDRFKFIFDNKITGYEKWIQFAGWYWQHLEMFSLFPIYRTS